MPRALNNIENCLSRLADGNDAILIDPQMMRKNNTLGRIFRQLQRISENMKENSSALESLAKGKPVSVSPSGGNPLSRPVSQISSHISALLTESRNMRDVALAGSLGARMEAGGLPGVYGEIAENLNEGVETLFLPVEKIHSALKGLTVNDFSSQITGDYQGEIKELTDDMNAVCERLTALTASIEKIARGDTGDIDKYREIGRRSDADRMIPAVCLAMQNIRKLVSAVGETAKNIQDGNVYAAKVDSSGFEGGYKDILEGVGEILHAFSVPLLQTSNLMSALVVNDYTLDVETDAKGDFAKLADLASQVMGRLRYLQIVASKISQGEISELENVRKVGKRSENDQLAPSFLRMMESIQALMEESKNIAAATVSGNFSYVCNADGFSGEYREIIASFEDAFRVVAGFMKEVNDVMQSMSDGSLHIAMRSDYDGQFHSLAEAINLTAGRLGEVVDEITEYLLNISNGNLNLKETHALRGDYVPISTAINTILRSLNSLMGQISVSADQVSAGSFQVSNASQTLSQGAAEQAGSVEELTSTITEIAAQIRTNAENANSAKELSAEGSANAKKGDEQMKQMLASMKAINEGSAGISKIIKTIDDIAFQTNILALNAAVEAARAGSAGKGFAVVAEEVRNLAAKSADAVKGTTALIEENISKVKAGTDIANGTAAELNKILVNIEKTSAFIASIAEASNEQATAITQIDTGVEQVSQVVQSNAATAEESAASSEELSSQAETLKQMVSQFKLRDGRTQTVAAKEKTGAEPPAAVSEKHGKPVAAGSPEFGKY